MLHNETNKLTDWTHPRFVSFIITDRSNLRHLGAVVECVEASVAGVRRHPLAQPAALLALGAVLVAVGGRQIAAVASTITVQYRICESNQRTECVVASVGGCGGQTGAEAAALLAVLGDVGLGSWNGGC